MDVIRVDQHNTVESLRDQLQSLLNAEHDDGGFPILRPGRDEDGLRMVGYIGASELEHALGRYPHFPIQISSDKKYSRRSGESNPGGSLPHYLCG